MIFDLFDSPELLDVQRIGFYRFLKEGIPQLLSKEFPIKINNGRYSLILYLSESYVKLIAPEDNPRDCILKMKTYSCKLYAQVKLVCTEGAKEKIIYQSLPEWVLLGQIPMMTKRGHFIINGSPRVIVHQVVRAPGIYFQKAIKKDDQNRARFYGDIIPLKGAWVRLQMTKKGRVEAKFKKGKKVEVEFLQKCLQVIENQAFLQSMHSFSPLFGGYTKASFRTISSKNFSANAVAQNLRTDLDLQATTLSKSFCSKISLPVKSAFVQQKQSIPLGDKTLIKTVSFRESAPTFLYDDYSKLLEKKKSKAESQAEHDAFIHTYDKLYRTAQDKELEEWQRKKKNQNFFKGSFLKPAALKKPGLLSPSLLAMQSKSEPSLSHVQSRALFAQGKDVLKTEQPIFLDGFRPSSSKSSKTRFSLNKAELCVAKRKRCKEERNGFCVSSFPENTFKRRKCSENLFATFKLGSRYDLGLLGREKIRAKFGFAETKFSPLGLGKVTSFLQKGHTQTEKENTVVFLQDFAKQNLSRKAQGRTFALQKYALSHECTFASKSKQSKIFRSSRKALQSNVFRSSRKDDSTQLTAADLCSATLWLYKLRKGEETIDDIDHSQNRRVRTSGELLQTQFENGVYRLKNLLLTKLQGFALQSLSGTPKGGFVQGRTGDLNSSTFSSIFRSSYKPRYNRKLAFKGSNKAELSYVERKSFVNALSKPSTLISFKTTPSLQSKSVTYPYPRNPLRGYVKELTFARLGSLLQSKSVAKSFARGAKQNREGRVKREFVLGVVGTLRAETSHQKCKTFGEKGNRLCTKPGQVFRSETLPNNRKPRAFATLTPSVRESIALQSEGFRKAVALKSCRFQVSPKGGLCKACKLVFRKAIRLKKQIVLESVSFKKQILQPDSLCQNSFTKRRSCSFLPVLTESTKFARDLSTRGDKDLQNSYKLSTKELFSTKPITGALREFFGSNPLSQYMDQTNPLAEITHKRRISSLGIGGVSRESAGMAIRGIHPTHYGRICPIETPEGKNAGLVNSLAFYTKVDKNGFLETPYYRVFKGQIQSSLGFSFCSAKKELLTSLHIAPSDLQKSSNNILRTRGSLLAQTLKKGYVKDFAIPSKDFTKQSFESVPVRAADNLLDVFKKEKPYKVQAIAISPIQMISVATSLIPFLEHNDANRALMGSNMQRQAVPLMIAERPIVGTGLESTVIIESGHITESVTSGFASHVDANKVVVDKLLYKKKEIKTIANAICVVRSGSNPTKLLARFCFARNPLWGYAKDFARVSLYFCKAKVSSFGGVAKQNRVTPPKNLATLLQDFALQNLSMESQSKSEPSLWLEPQRKSKQSKSFKLLLCKTFPRKNKTRLCTCQCTPLTLFKGRSGFVQRRERRSFKKLLKPFHFRDASFFSSTVSPLTTFSRSNQNTCITEKPLIREFDWVQKGDSLSDCSASNNSELAVGKNVLLAYIPWEGYNFEDAIVISERLVKEHVYTSLHIERYVFQAQDLKDGNEWFTKNLPGVNAASIQHLEKSGLPKIGSLLKEGDIIVGKIRYLSKKPSTPYERLLCDILGEKNFAARNKSLYVPKGVRARVIYHKVISVFENDPENRVRPLGSAKTVHLFLGEKRVIQVGDKISGRHGNKGVISTILPRQDMPYLPDGTPIDLILNPLGVPSRMNVGQVLECLLGLAASYLKQQFKVTAFDERYGVEASKSIVFLKLYQARLMSGQNWLFQVAFPGKTRLVDGRSGECFDQWITVGKAYILKLIHMVSEKIHARSTGPYALITQQPLRGRSNKGGQRLGEMEVWALEGFGAAYTLQELLTKKSDDFFGRKQIVDSILPNPSSIVDTLKPSDRIDKNKNVLGHPEIFKVLLCELQALCLDLGVYIVTPESFQRTFLGLVH